MRLSDEIRDAIFRHAESAYPGECCGIIFASGRVLPCTNIAARPDRFELSAADQITLAESFDGPDPAAILYHSHPDAEPALSTADRSSLSWHGHPIYPCLQHCIIEIRAGRAVRVVMQNP